MNIITLYTNILKDAGLVVDNAGFVSVNNEMFNGADKNEPVLIDGKRLVLPTHAQLSEPNNGNKIVFHPLSENLLRGESLIITNLRNLYTTRLNFTLGIVVNYLIQLCASVNKHKTLNPDQSAVLSFAPNCDETTAKAFSDITAKVLATNSNFIHFYLKRSGIVKGQKYARAGIVSFPFFEELLKDQDLYYGIKLRKKDRESFINIFKFVLKDIDCADSYNRGSNSDVAPFLDALMKTFLAIVSELNDVVLTYSGVYEDLEILQFTCDWQETFEDLSVMSKEIRKIPNQPGNEGENRKVEVPVSGNPNSSLAFNPGTVSQPVVNAQQPYNPVSQPTVQHRMEEAPSKEGKASFAELMNKGNQQVSYPPNMYPQMPNGMPMGQVPVHPAMMQQYYQQPQQVALPPSLMPMPMPGQMQPQYFNDFNNRAQPGQPRSRSSLPNPGMMYNQGQMVNNGRGNGYNF